MSSMITATRSEVGKEWEKSKEVEMVKDREKLGSFAVGCAR